MSAPARVPAAQPSPELFFETITAYQRTQALKTAMELDLFTAIGEGNRTPAALAGRCAASPRGLRILCDYLVVSGFLEKSGEQYALTRESSLYLDRRSPACVTSSVRFLGHPYTTRHFQDLTAAVRKGGTVTSEQGALEPENPIWVEFARGMAPLMQLPAELMARLVNASQGRPWKVLDLAAGHGAFGITIAKHNPQAEIVAVDWPGVLELAQENARAAGVLSRYRTIPGSAFNVEFGTGYDLVLLTNFLHHFDAAGCEALLRKIHASLKSGGRVLTLEFVPNEDRVTPRQPAGFGLTMLVSTPSGDAYTFSEYEQMFRHAGFASSELHEIPPAIQRVILSKKS